MSGIPDPWQALMDRAGITSLQGLSTACGGQPSPNAVGDIILRRAPGSQESMTKLAEVLGVTISDLNAIQTRHQGEPLRVPPGTENLTPGQRQALTTIIRALVASREQVLNSQ